MNFPATNKSEPLWLCNLDGHEKGYGHIPFLLAHASDYNAGVLWLNPSETAVDISDLDNGRRARFLSEGGFLDVFIFADGIKDMLHNFHRLTGFPVIPPMWALGYHQAKAGYSTQKIMTAIMDNLTRFNIPWDVIYIDHSSSKGNAPFEFDHKGYPAPEKLMARLREERRWTVRLTDLHLPLWPDHIQYQEAKAGRYFVRNADGTDLTAVAWPGMCSYPDFTNRTVFDWWVTKNYYGEGRDYTTPELFHWNDMNEPCFLEDIRKRRRTFQKDARLAHGLEDRETHNAYGMFQMAATYRGTLERNHPPHLRPFVLTRSFFVGAQKFGWTWTGDNHPDWEDLRKSIPMISIAGLNGFGFTGEDVGGHAGRTHEELLVRWYQTGAWVYPYFREHCALGTPFREPWLWPEPAFRRMVRSIYDRYKLIGLWYTHSIYYNWTGRPPTVPLFYEWPEVESLHRNEDDVLVGDAILVSGVFVKDAKTRHVEKPPGNWYEFRNGRPFLESGDVPVTIDDIPLHIRGGRIVPYYPKAVKTVIDTIPTPLTLIVAMDDNGAATGSLYLDDGVTYNYTLGGYLHRKFVYESGKLHWTKADAKEKETPEFLKKSVVDTLVFYEKNGVRRVTGLTLKVCDEWTWDRNEYIAQERPLIHGLP
jgi:alpha 1,3-glucosidase